MKNYIKGLFRKSIYKSEKGYIIGLFKVRETNDPKMEEYINKTVTFTGYFHELNEDEVYIFYGEEVDHPKYGLQYQVSEYDRVKPKDKDGVIAFLSSDLFPNVGETLATKIVEKLGEEALDLIIKDGNILLSVPKMSRKKASIIYETLVKYEDSHKTIVYLTELGFNMKDSLSIYSVYRNNTTNIIQNNIFRLLNDISDISYPKVDEISLKIGYKPDDHRRVEACIIYVMKNLSFKNGDTYSTIDEIYKGTTDSLNIYINDYEFETYINNLIEDELIVVENKNYYLKNMYDAEINIVNKIRILNNIPSNKYSKIDNYINELEKDNEITYNEKQKKAIKSSLEKNIIIITGGPGTGKTTIIRAITSLYQKLNNMDYEELITNIALLAPTGRASKRVSESTMLPSMTIHRFLKWNKETNLFGVNEQNKNNHKFIIIDEVSMIDINLLDSLFKGLNDNIKLVLVGDYNQLPSVGPGQVLKDLIDSDMVETIHLDLLYRQDDSSFIPVLAQEIKNSDLTSDFLQKRNDFEFVECSNELIKPNLTKICQLIVNKKYSYNDVQIMAPMYAGVNGIDNLNKELQKVFNPPDENKKEITFGDVTYREGDKILQLVNMPDENIFNGDVGYIKKISMYNESDSGKNEIHVDFEGIIVKYNPKDFIKITHGFIISIHKSQGSEFDMVIIPISNAYNRMLYKKLIYTAVTRAKKKLILLGDVNAFRYSVVNDREYTRKTSLLEKLIIV